MSNLHRKKYFVPQLYCNLFGHRYQVSKQITAYVNEYKCCHCKKELTTNSKGGLTELTSKFREINSVLENIHYRRQLKLNQTPVDK
ncbi:hypothetical protein ES676_12185 [Bizionia saleffrena]|uniref:Uncharacterized protein n=1 Tax=Bizionia saleffrena TaxID=291189 RepID=A0A8H2LCL0_9FLAO|nr:hypothetical protein [Bizionia saleffrena]TYB71767.1 hypothetical protein ES676_12185 [Bizionia saleffrena]